MVKKKKKKKKKKKSYQRSRSYGDFTGSQTSPSGPEDLYLFGGRQHSSDAQHQLGDQIIFQ